MTGIFFGSTMGTTEAVAADIAKQLGVADADVHNVADTPAGEVQKYDLLVLGSSTWGAGELQDDWYDFLDALKRKALSGKRVALFGSYGWGDGEWMRTWEENCRDKGANLVCDSVICQETPDDEALSACRSLGEALA